MKKLVILLAFAGLFAACGDDDSGETSGAKPISIVLGENTPVTFAYDDRDRLQSLTKDGTVTTFTYNDQSLIDRITTGANFYEFTYNDSGKFLSYRDQADNVTPMIYISDNKYTVNGLPLQFNSVGDIIEYGGVSFEYQNQKGPFANVKNLNGFILGIAEPSSKYYASKKRHAAYTNVQGNFQYSYVEGDHGLPATQTLNNNVTTFQYSE